MYFNRNFEIVFHIVKTFLCICSLAEAVICIERLRFFHVGNTVVYTVKPQIAFFKKPVIVSQHKKSWSLEVDVNYAKIMNHDDQSFGKNRHKNECILLSYHNHNTQWFLNSLKLKLPFPIANVLKLHFLDSFKIEITGIWEKYENF